MVPAQRLYFLLILGMAIAFFLGTTRPYRQPSTKPKPLFNPKSPHPKSKIK